MIIRRYPTFLNGGHWMFSSNTNSLGYQSFKGANWALVSGLHLGDTVKGLTLVLSLLTFGLAFWAYAPIISNPISCPPAFS